MNTESKKLEIDRTVLDASQDSASLWTRSYLLDQIVAVLKVEGCTQVEAAKRCGVTQPRISDLLRGRVSQFSLDALVNIATAMGRKVRVELEAA